MENVIIVGILLVLLVGGMHSTIKHFKGESSCCGGGSAVKVKKKKLKKVVAKKTIIVKGMTCEHCKNRVERALNEIEGVSAGVNLKKKEVVVSMEKEVAEEQLCRVIEKAGYEVTEIR